jgi:formamidopyrimidine-DNA glycosylase
MPELPDITIYIEALERRVLERPLRDIRLGSPFVLRTVDPPVAAFRGRPVRRLARLGKRIVLGFDDELFIVLHLMIAGRLHWRPPGAPLARRLGLAAFDFAEGSLVLTEAGTRKRAALHLLRGESALAAHDPGGLEPLGTALDAFATALTRENHTVKRALTDPTLFSGIGNAYSDEILHRARLSPVRMTRRLTGDEIVALHGATQAVLGGMDRPPPGRGGRRLPREGHRIPAGDGGPWQVRPPLPGLRCPDPAHRPCHQRDELLRALPEWRPPARRSGAVAPAQGRLAAVAGRAGGAPGAASAGNAGAVSLIRRHGT